MMADDPLTEFVDAVFYNTFPVHINRSFQIFVILVTGHSAHIIPGKQIRTTDEGQSHGILESIRLAYVPNLPLGLSLLTLDVQIRMLQTKMKYLKTVKQTSVSNLIAFKILLLHHA